MRKILIGAVLALCFVMVSLTLVGKTLPRLADPSAARAKEPLPDESLVLAAAVTVARVAPADFVESGNSSVSSPVAIRMTLTALPITSAGRFSPRGPRGMFLSPWQFIADRERSALAVRR